jgi:hypothetical protein
MANEKRLQGAARIAVSNRNYRRARDRALVRLANLYPDQYKDLLKEEKENDKALGKEWIDLDGRTSDRNNLYSSTGDQGEDSYQEDHHIRSESAGQSR